MSVKFATYNGNANVFTYVDVKFEFEELESLLNNPNEYIKFLSEKMDVWLVGIINSNKLGQLSRMEKMDILSKDPIWSEYTAGIKFIFQKIDEARYGLPVDSFFCKQIHEKVVEIFKK